MLKKVLVGVVVLIAVFVVVVMVQPDEYHVERSTQIEAPADVVWAEISSFEQWAAWNPWQKMDPQQKVTVTGEPGTVGHASAWEGEKTGKGSMTLSDVQPSKRLGMTLKFEEPMSSVAESAMEMSPEGESVRLTWSMDGKNDFMGKFFSMMMNMDEMVGSEYEKGLASLKTIAETNAKKQAEAMAAAEAPAEEGATEEAPLQEE